MNLELVGFSPSRSTAGGMIGLAIIRLVDLGINLHEIRVQRRHNGHFIAKASRFPLVTNGVQLRNRDSDELRWGYTVTFRDEAKFIEFSDCVLKLVRERYPELFNTARPAHQEPAHA